MEFYSKFATFTDFEKKTQISFLFEEPYYFSAFYGKFAIIWWWKFSNSESSGFCPGNCQVNV